MFDLVVEMSNAILGIEQRHIDRLIAAGVPEHVVAGDEGLHQWGIMRVQPEGKYGFVPDPEDGKEAYISFSRHRGGVSDLIAWHPASPANWRWRIGDEPLLNLDNLERRWPGEGPLKIHATPLDFLRGGAEGVVILDWSASRDIRRLAMEDAIVGPKAAIDRLDSMLRAPVRMPRFQRTEAPRAAA